MNTNNENEANGRLAPVMCGFLIAPEIKGQLLAMLLVIVLFVVYQVVRHFYVAWRDAREFDRFIIVLKERARRQAELEMTIIVMATWPIILKKLRENRDKDKAE